MRNFPALFILMVFCFVNFCASAQTPCNFLEGGGDSAGMTFWAPGFSDTILVWTSYDENGWLASDSLSNYHTVPLSLPLEEGTSFTICAEWYETSWDWDGLAWCCVEMTWVNGTLVGNPVNPLNIEAANTSRLALVPNPAQNELEIQGLTSDADIFIFNVSGQLVLEKAGVNQSTVQIDLSMLSPGIYHVKCSNGWSERLIISR
jgi:hypothetical protein